jgi:hypothetical protein
MICTFSSYYYLGGLGIIDSILIFVELKGGEWRKLVNP